MKSKITLFLLLISFIGNAQDDKNSNEIKKESKNTFLQFDISTPLTLNTNENAAKTGNDDWFIPNGLSAKFGYGIQKNKWLGLSFHTGIDWKGNAKMVAVPLYGNFSLSPSLGNGSRITLQAGYGKGFALGRGNLVGNYQKYSVGFQTEDDIIIFAEISNYDFKIHNETNITSFSLGLALRTF